MKQYIKLLNAANGKNIKLRCFIEPLNAHFWYLELEIAQTIIIKWEQITLSYDVLLLF